MATPTPRPRLRIIPALAGNTPVLPRSAVALEDHPRSRGEYSEAHRDHLHAYGSSPLSRGIRTARTWSAVRIGIIPALAGNTHSSRASCTEVEDHPRSRGEYCRPLSAPITAGGSSPLSRGIRVWVGAGVEVLGIIPALAGNTHLDIGRRDARGDHPRSRGEYPG